MQPAPEIPREVAALIFRLSQPGQSVMTQADDAYVVATLTAINHPDPAAQKTCMTACARADAVDGR